MINSLLQDKEYSEILKLRKHFYSKIPREKYDGWQDKPENAILISYINDIDNILEAKYLADTNNFYNYNLSPSN